MATDSVETVTTTTAPVTRPVAVIDFGTSSIRMAIAEIDEIGGVRTLETLSQAVSLGKDTFTKGYIQKATIEDCVRVLKSYDNLLQQYKIEGDDQIRVIATSAVREAENQLAFLDRIYIATGIQVEPLDEAEVNRITYMGIQPYLKADPALDAAKTVVTEIGGGSTELLLVQGNQVLFSHTYRLGSLRLREQLEAFRAPETKLRDIMQNQIDRVVDQIVQELPKEDSFQMIALGGDVRFAASQLIPGRKSEDLGRLPVAKLQQLTDKMLELSADVLVQRYHLSFPDAETLGPALLAYVQLANALKLDEVLITDVNLRDGMLNEMAVRGAGSEEFNDQVIRSTLELGRKFQFDEVHAKHVAELSRSLFRQLVDEHELDPRFELILYNSALLHEIGLFLSNDGYHKHSMYMIQHSELFGLSERDLLLVSLVARYHRRASPKPSHTGYATLDRNSRVAVAKMSAILRIADALDHSRSQRISEVECIRENAKLVISVPHVDDLSLEQLAMKQNGTLFDEIFGMQVLLRRQAATSD